MNVKKALLASFASLLAFSGPAAFAADTSDTPLYISIEKAGGAVRPIVVPLDKAVIVDLPVPARDVLLSNPNIADSVVRTSTRVFIIGRKMGQTNAFFFDAAGRQIANLEIRVEQDVAPLNAMIKRFTPEANVKAEAVNGALVLSGSVKTGAEADRIVQLATNFGSSDGSKPELINLINVEGKEQVLVKVRMVEMSRTLVKQLGIDVATPNGVTLNDNLSLHGSGFGFPAVNDSNLLSNNNFSVNGSALGGLDTAINYNDGSSAVDARLQAFERVGLVHVLAEPNLTAISGEPAKFLAGGEFPVPTKSDLGVVTVEFKPFGVGLSFTPVVLSGGRISLKLSTEVSELTPDGATTVGDITVSALQVRRAETTVEMPSGGALVMAGLIQQRTRQALEGIPGAKDLPILGALMRSRDFINNETELVIIVTPYLVDATKPENLKTPGDGYVNASDTAAILSGRLNAVYKGGQTDGKRLQGPTGHVIE
jgi:pilus assembly protein CpaC